MASAEPQPDDDGGGFILTWDRIKSVAPPWFGRVEALVTTSIVVGGAEFELWKEPVAFVRAVFADGLISGVQYLVGTFAAGLLGMLDTVVSTGSGVGMALLSSTGAVGDSLIFVIDNLTGVLETLIVASGPLSPIVVVLIYGGIILGTAAAVRAVLAFLGWAP